MDEPQNIVPCEISQAQKDTDWTVTCMGTVQHGPVQETQGTGWAKKSVHFFREIKGTFFIFTNDFTDLDVLSMSAIPTTGF